MKYAIWFVRLVFVAWMLPAGINHFIPLFPQPLGNMPLSRELFAALDASGLFHIVKAVELIAALCLLTGFYVPLGLLLCMPVSFCVWYWDTPLQGWGSVSSIYGWAVLLCNVALCLAYLPSYREMLAARAAHGWPDRKQIVVAARLVFGSWMMLSGLNFFLAIYPMPAGQEPLAVQLMSALAHSQLLDVAMGIQLVAGALIVAGLFVPLALCVVMPVCVCAAYWAVILEHEPLGAILSLVAVGLNALLMLAYLDHYRSLLGRQAIALGEASGRYEALFVDASGRSSRMAFISALVPLVLAAAFYHYWVFGLPGMWAMLVMLFPAVVLHARRLHDMGRSAWLLLVPGIPVAAAIWFHMFDRGNAQERLVILVALAVSAAVTLWGLIGKGQAEANRYGAPGG